MTPDLLSIVVAAAMAFVLIPTAVFGYAFARYLNFFARVGMIARPLGIDRWTGVGAMVAFLVGFTWIAAVGGIPGEGDPLRLPVTLALVGFGAGLFGVALALSNFGRYRRLRDGEFVAGVAEAESGETVEAPLSGESCLAWAIRVREHTSFYRRGGPPPIHRDAGGTTFPVQSATERVRVDASDTALDAWPVGGRPSRSDFVAREREGVPERVTAYAADAGLGDPDRSRIYEEVRVEPGDSVTVFGTDDGRTAVGGPGTVLAVRPGEAVRRRLRRRIGAGPAGAALALVCFGVAAVLAGTV